MPGVGQEWGTYSHNYRADTGKNFDKKYVSTWDDVNKMRWDQLNYGLAGSCINAGTVDSSNLTMRRSGDDSTLNNLKGIVADGKHMYEYFGENGAICDFSDFSVGRAMTKPSVVRSYIEGLCKKPVNNKLLYLTGHGDDRDGEWFANSGSDFVGLRHCLDWMGQGGHVGHMTFVLDLCYSGQWAQTMFKYMGKNSATSTALQPLMDAAEAKGQRQFINFRCSSYYGQVSYDQGARQGGRYTFEFIKLLRREYLWTDGQTGNGWGSRVFTQRKIDTKTSAWTGTSKQTDISIDFVYHAKSAKSGKKSGKWQWFFPGHLTGGARKAGLPKNLLCKEDVYKKACM